MRREPNDAGNMIVLEAILVGLLLFGALYYVVAFNAPSSPTTNARSELATAGEDALIVLAGLPACDGLAGDDLKRCRGAYGRSALTRTLTEALTGAPGNATLKMRTLIPSGVQWNLYLDNTIDTLDIVVNAPSRGERVSTAYAFTPEWNSTRLVTHLDRYNWSAAGENDAYVYALPAWKTRPMRHDAGSEPKIEFTNGHEATLGNLVIDGERGVYSTLAYWRMNEGSGTRAADTLGRFPLDGVGGRWAPGRVGQSLTFAAAADELVAGPSADLRATSLSLLAWVRPDAWTPVGDSRLLHFDDGNGAMVDVFLEGGTRHPAARYSGSGAPVTVTASSPIPTLAWSHLTATIGRGTLTLYVDGVAAASAPIPGPLGVAGMPSIRLGGPVGASDPFMGRLDEVRAYKRALAPEEFSILRWTAVPPHRAAAPGWDHLKTPTRGVASLADWNGVALPGSTVYRVSEEPLLATHAAALARGLEDSTLAVYHNGSYARSVQLGETVVVEFDFRPLRSRLLDEGLTVTDNPYVTISVQSPTPQPWGVNERRHETYNFTHLGPSGFVNFTLPRSSLLGAHVITASANLTLDGDASVLARKVDYFSAVLPRTFSPAINPVYRAVLELWIPGWE